MPEPFSEFTKVFCRPCADCGREMLILVGSRIPQGEVVSARCPDCTVEFRKKGKLPKELEAEAEALERIVEVHCGLLPGSDDVKIGPGGGIIPYEDRRRKIGNNK